MTYIHQHLFDDLRLFKPNFAVSGPVAEADIASAEQALGVTFPPAYRAFVAAIGACKGYFGDDIFGVAVTPRRARGVSVVTHTLRARREGLAPRYLVLKVQRRGSTYLDLGETESDVAEGSTVVPASEFDMWLRTKLERDLKQAEMDFDTAVGESFCEQLDPDIYDIVPHDYSNALQVVLATRLTPQLIDTTLRENVESLTAGLSAYFESSPAMPLEAVADALYAVLWRWPAVPSDEDPQRPRETLWLRDAEDTPQRLKLALLLRRIEAYVDGEPCTFTLHRSQGYGLTVNAWETQCDVAPFPIAFDALTQLVKRGEEWFYNLHVRCDLPFETFHFGVFDSSALVLHASRTFTFDVIDDFSETEETEPLSWFVA